MIEHTIRKRFRTPASNLRIANPPGLLPLIWVWQKSPHFTNSFSSFLFAYSLRRSQLQHETSCNPACKSIIANSQLGQTPALVKLDVRTLGTVCLVGQTVSDSVCCVNIPQQEHKVHWDQTPNFWIRSVSTQTHSRLMFPH